MEFVAFRLKGRIGHFLKAEAGASALSYPIPPRTAVMGLLGAVLGLAKDKPQVELQSAAIAVSGKLPQTFWHRVKLRKEDPEYLSLTIKRNQKLSQKGKAYKATLILQEWLFEPEYTVWASLPQPYHDELANRLKERRWHFQPCLGISEMSAELKFIANSPGKQLPEATHLVNSIFPKDCGEMDVDSMYEANLSVNSMRMPRSVSPDRVFSHAQYFMERNARPVPVKTSKSFQWQDEVIVCL